MSNSLIWPYQVQPFRARVNLEGMAMKRYSVFSRTPQTCYQFNVKSRTLVCVCVWGGLTPLQGCSRVYSTALPADLAVDSAKCHKQYTLFDRGRFIPLKSTLFLAMLMEQDYLYEIYYGMYVLFLRIFLRNTSKQK